MRPIIAEKYRQVREREWRESGERWELMF